MPSAGPNFFSVTADNGGTGSAWAGASSVELAPDGSYATNNPGPGIATTYLKCTTWGSSIPIGSSVGGVTMALYGHVTTGETLTIHVAMVKAGVVQSSSSYSVTMGTSDGWTADIGTNGLIPGNVGLTDTDVNQSGFGIAFSLTSSSGNHISIDSVRMTVFYETGDAWIALRRRRQRDMGQILKQNQTAEPILFFMADSTDHITGKTGLSPTVKLGKNGAAGTAPSGAVSEVDSTNLPGWYKVAGNSTDSNTIGPLTLHATATGADPCEQTHQVVAFDPRDGVRMGQTALPNADAEAAGGLFTRGTGAGQVNQDANGRLDVNITAVESDTTTPTIMKSLYGAAVMSGTVNTVTDATNFTLTSSALSANNGDYAGMWLVFTSGSNKGVPRVISTYTGASKQVQFTGSGMSGSFPETVTAGDSWIMLGGAK